MALPVHLFPSWKKVLLNHPNITCSSTWHNMFVKQLLSAKSQLPYFTSNTQISVKSRHQQYNNHKIFSPWTLFCTKIDNMHKQIEVAMQVSEIFFPISFVRNLLKVNRNQPQRVIQMRKEDYQNPAKMPRSKLISYSKVAQLRFAKANLHQVGFKLSQREKKF